MANRTVRIGERQLSAEIDDPGRTDWRGYLYDAPHLCEGDVTVVLVDPGHGHAPSKARARAVPSGPDQPLALEGLESFS